MATTDELLDALMKDYKKPEDLIGENEFEGAVYSTEVITGMMSPGCRITAIVT